MEFMKKIFSVLIASIFVANINAQLKLGDITSGKYAPQRAGEMVSSVDGESYYKANSNQSMIVKYSYKTGLPTDTVFNVKKARECPFDSFQGFIIAPDEKRIILYDQVESIYRHSYKAVHYYFDIRRNLVKKLSDVNVKQSVPVFSRDGRMLAYVADNNIWLAKFDYDTESQITKDGEFGKIINGATDWVYEEEFVTTSLMDFSADSRLLAFVRFDETEVPQYSMQMFSGQLYPSAYTFKYPKAGEKNSKVTCNVFDVDAKTIRKINIPENNTEYIPRIQFLPTGDELAVFTLNRNQNNFNMYFANARSTVSRLVLHEENERYIDSELFSSIRFFNDQFTYLSEKNGYSHIYLYGNNGVMLKQLTTGNYDVTEVLEVDPVAKTVFYQSTEGSPLRRDIYKIDLIKGLKTKLSANAGYNDAIFSKNGKYYVSSFQNISTPPVVTVHDALGKQLRVLIDNATLKNKLAAVSIPQKEFLTVKGNDGSDLNAYMIKPLDFSPNRKYPVVMIQYNGPNHQLVLDKYIVDWDSYLATQGFIVVCVDGRGTGARGEAFRKCTYQNLGIIESDDQIAAARYLSTLPYVDGSKIGIWGWSYGGYNALMSMSRSAVFAAGVAIAPVTSWRFYDSVYTERYMRTPEQNMQGYVNGSPITLAGQLHGNLLLIHGSADDNVHYQNTLEYANALVNANKQFDMFVFTDKDHSMRGSANRSYLYEKVIKFFKTNM